MRPVARGRTIAFVKFSDEGKQGALQDLVRYVGGNFTGRLEGVFKVDKGEINVVMEVKNGAIVAMSISGIENAKGVTALRRFIELFPQVSGFFEIIELDPAGVDLDLEYNSDCKLPMPSSFNLFVERLKLRLERERSVRKEYSSGFQRPFRVSTKEQSIQKQVPEGGGKRGQVQLEKPSPTSRSLKPKEERRESIVETDKEDRGPRKIEIEYKDVAREQVKVAEEHATESRRSVEIKDVTEAGVKESVLPKVEMPVGSKPIPADMLLEEGVEELERKVARREEKLRRSPEEIVSGLPFDDEIDKISKLLSSDKERLVAAIYSTVHVLKHDRGTIIDALRDTVDSSTTSDYPVQLIVKKNDTLYNVFAYKGLIKAAFKINEKTMDVELAGKETLYDLVKNLYEGEHEYTLVNSRENYILAGIGLKTIEEEEGIEEEARGFLGKLKRLFGGR